METIRYRPVRTSLFGFKIDFGCLIEADCKELYKSGEINDTWDIEILIPEQDKIRIVTEKPSTLWEK